MDGEFVRCATDDNFVKVVLSSDKLVIVDFYGDNCAACRQQALVFSKMPDYEGVRVVMCKVENAPEVASYYQINSLPTIMVFKDGDVVEELPGLQSEARVVKAIEENLK